jgi:hypothetical protein
MVLLEIQDHKKMRSTNFIIVTYLNKISNRHPVGGQDDGVLEVPEDVDLAGLVQAGKGQQEVARRSKVEFLAAVEDDLKGKVKVYERF